MAKKSRVFECQHCGFVSPKWLGKCNNCNQWESFVEVSQKELESLKPLKNTSKLSAISIAKVEQESVSTFSSTQKELDIVLGGLCPGVVFDRGLLAWVKAHFY
ncbi:hypothetical protein NHP190003_07410 [Helicobacter sp. NHP19-003]|uniref:LapB rubredoxin metal binding domain-containing protein n=1 Tax=Helicobacter gastrocanis TaxID=2849641 RepID=A0ABM7SBQ4_9HELI|nr:hypothetical protein NHP190003_07410 [Helicobacter sp. NHP19-003]